MSQANDIDVRYLEDFQIGDTTETGKCMVTREMLLKFAEQYDPQPMHLDENAARESVFGELVGSGWLTLALTMRLLVDARMLGSTPIVGVEFKDVRFITPLRPDDTLQVSAEVITIRHSKSRNDRGFIELTVTTKNSEGSAIVTQQWRLVVPCRPNPLICQV